MHIYHSALPWTPTSSPTRRLYEHELRIEAKLVNAVNPTWDACIRIIPVSVGERVEAVVFSPSGALIAVHGKSCVEVFDAMTGMNRATFDGNMLISSVAFSPDDGFLVSGLWGMTINVWDVQTGTIFRTFKWTMRSSAHSVAFSSCGTMIASGNTDWTVRIWNILSGGCVCVFQGHSQTVTDVCWLATWSQVVSASNDRTVRIWDVQKQTCSRIFAQYSDPVVALASSRDLLLVAPTNRTMNIYDPQSGDIIHVIMSDDIIHSRFSIDGGKVLIASKNSGDIWNITTKTLTCVGSIDYNGVHATFSPDGTRVASIYGKFVKIWKTNAGYNHHEASTHVRDTIDDVCISPDERLVALKSKEGADILDATTGQSLFTHTLTDCLSIAFSLDLAFVAFLRRKVHIWNAHTHLHKSIAVDRYVVHIALSPDGSQLASLSSLHMKLWDLKSGGCFAHLQSDGPLWRTAQISFSTNASISISNNSNTWSWRIHKSRDSAQRSRTQNGGATKLPMVFIPTTEERTNEDAPTPCRSYRCDKDDEWILDHDGRHVLWIPPDERPQKVWNTIKCEKVMVIKTESGKIYHVNFSQS
jgi:WD40 repeat protein